MTRKSKKQVQNQSQSGRSMVEMLGVLAVIGVLSIGGIVGYKLAMNHYQANQIAHEMNMMRTDAQVKIAQGTENLTLGSPYDDHKINFNDYKTNFDCALANEEEVILNDVSCYAANAYYIELQEIPEDVCQPLVRLINGMDNLIDFYVNEPDAEGVGKDTCDEGNNTLTAIFGADSDSNAIKCDDAEGPECPENLPICLNHICVECETNAQCTAKGKDPHCHKATHTCEPCPDGGTYSHEEQACVISIDSAPFDDVSAQLYQCISKSVNPQFGPYGHTYTLYMKGHIDDYLVFYKDAQTDMTQSCPPPEGIAAIPCLPEPEVRCDMAQPRSRTAIGDLEAGHTGTLIVYSTKEYLKNHATVWGVLKE